MGSAAATGVVAAILVVALVVGLAPPTRASPGPGAGLTVVLRAQPASAPAPASVTFTASLVPGTASAEFNWTFGDGATYQQTATGSDQLTHRFAVAGTFDVEVTASGPDGFSSANVTVLVLDDPLTVTIGSTSMTGEAPFTVGFTATVAGGSGTYTALRWEFGDGSDGSGLHLNYTYQTPGEYIVNFTATDANGATATTSETIRISGPSASGGAQLSDAAEVAVVVAILLGAVGIASVALERSARRSSRAALAAPPIGALGGVASAPAGRPSADEGAAGVPPAESRRGFERILVHLYWKGRSDQPGIASPEASRDGIARAVQLDGSSVSRSLSRLVDAGLVVGAREHVPGYARRITCYALTPAGLETARALARAGPEPGAPAAG